MTTPDELERQHTLSTATTRYDELRMRDARAAVADDDAAAALTRDEALELLALSEVVIRKTGYGRQAMVRSARAAGASWTQIGAALGSSKQAAWEAHQRWVAEQARLHELTGHEGPGDGRAARSAGPGDGRPDATRDGAGAPD